MFKVVSKWAYHRDTIKIEWNLGKRCNLDCSYCPSEIHDNFSPHTDINKLKNAVDILSTLDKPIRLSLTGGEPCVHPNIEELISYIKIKKISWLSITTNITRPAHWYINQQENVDQFVFSLHYEKDYLRLFENILKFNEKRTNKMLVHVMAHHEYMHQVKETLEIFKKENIPFIVRRIRWPEGDRDSFNDSKYNLEDLNWIKKETATLEPNCLVDDNLEIHANDIIKLHMNQYHGWSCNAGIESLMINWDGEVYRATCRVGGSLGNIYNNKLQIPNSPISCTRKWCTCEADIPLTKTKSDLKSSL